MQKIRADTEIEANDEVPKDNILEVLWSQNQAILQLQKFKTYGYESGFGGENLAYLALPGCEQDCEARHCLWLPLCWCLVGCTRCGYHPGQWHKSWGCNPLLDISGVQGHGVAY